MNYTPYLELKKPQLGESALVEDLNANAEDLDDAIKDSDQMLAPIVTGDTAPAGGLSAGQFIIKDRTLYTVDEDLLEDASLTGKLTPVPNGGLNQLHDQIVQQGAWTLAGSETGSVAISYPSTAKQLLAIVNVDDSTYGVSIPFAPIYPKELTIRTGYARGIGSSVIESLDAEVKFTPSQHTAILEFAQRDTTNKISTSTMHVYYC